MLLKRAARVSVEKRGREGGSRGVTGELNRGELRSTSQLSVANGVCTPPNF